MGGGCNRTPVALMKIVNLTARPLTLRTLLWTFQPHKKLKEKHIQLQR